jgi:hypothetical protein
MSVGFGANVAWPGGGSKAPIPAVRMLWVARGGVTETPGFGRHNFGGSHPP